MNGEQGSPVNLSSAVQVWRDRSSALITFAVILGLLYYGRSVLIPLTLALMLALLFAPLVSVLRRVGLGHQLSVLAALLTFSIAGLALAVVLGSQVLRLAVTLPQYEATLQQKLQSLDQLTQGHLNGLTNEIRRYLDRRGDANLAVPSIEPSQASAAAGPVTAIPVEVQQAPVADPLQLVDRLLVPIWTPVQTIGIVLFVLLFVLLEYEALRDRFIRVAGGGNIRQTTLALNEAGERLSRFFVSQVAVNMGLGLTLGIGMWLLGVPHAVLWATLAAVLRFVPYIGVWIAGVFATLMAVALVPGWALGLSVLLLFAVVEFIVGQLVEPQLYGHATGMSALSVVVAAIFWSALWGPIGLIVSTPLTLCLVVAARHIQALRFVDLLLGNAQALTLSQKFCQRALSGDSQEIIRNAREYLKDHTLAAYCDEVVIPALHLGLLEFETGAISAQQRITIRDAIVRVVETLCGDVSRRAPLQRRRDSVLEQMNSARTLRLHREQIAGKWQGPTTVTPGTIVLCLELGGPGDDLAAELLARVLREQNIDARHFSVEDVADGPPPDSTVGALAVAFLVSAFADAQRKYPDKVIERIRERNPNAALVQVLLPGLANDHHPAWSALPGEADYTIGSFVQAIRLCREHLGTGPSEGG